MIHMNITGIVVPHDIEQPVTQLEFERGDLAKMREVVEGNVEVLDIEERKISLWFNEEGKLMEMPINYRATFILWVYRPEFAGVADPVVGNALITGMPDGRGDTKTTPKDFMKLLFETSEYEITWNFKGGTERQAMTTTFKDWPSAFEFAYQLNRREQLNVENVRVVPKQ